MPGIGPGISPMLRKVSGVPDPSDLLGWYKPVDDTDFLESIADNDGLFLPRVAEFNGSDDILSIGTLSMTVASYCIKITPTDFSNSGHIFSVSSTSVSYIRFNTDGKIRIEGKTGSDTGDFSYVFSINTNYKIIITVNAAKLFSLYVDGLLKDSFTLSTNAIDVSRICGASTSARQLGAKVSNISIYNRVITSGEITGYTTGIIPTTPLYITYPTGQGDYEYDLTANENHGTWSGTGSRFDYDADGSTYAARNGYSLWEHATSDPIQVPFDLTGSPISLTAGVNIPADYTHTRDVQPSVDKWNMADALVDFDTGNYPSPSVLDDGNTMLWVDYKKGITKDVSDLVSSWADQSGNDNHLLQAVGSNQPLLTANGILFDGVDNFMKCVPFTLEQPEYIYMVIKQVSWTSLDRLFDGNTASSVFMEQTATSPSIRMFGGTYSGANANLAIGSYGILRILFNGASSKFIVNETTPTTSSGGNNDSDGFNLASRSGTGTQSSNIEVKEIIIRKVADSGVNEQDIYDYLSNKYFTNIFDRSYTVAQTPASRASIFYNSDHTYRYHVTEAADYAVMQTFFETDSQDKASFGKVVYDGSDIIRYDEHLSYDTKKTGAPLAEVKLYCNIP